MSRRPHRHSDRIRRYRRGSALDLRRLSAAVGGRPVAVRGSVYVSVVLGPHDRCRTRQLRASCAGRLLPTITGGRGGGPQRSRGGPHCQRVPGGDARPRARCLIEFISRPRDERDIHRHDYLPGWDPDDEDREEADSLYDQISKHLADLSWQRAEPPEQFPGWAYDLPHFVLRLFEEFVAEVRKGMPWTTMIESGVVQGRKHLPPVPASLAVRTTSGAFTAPSTTDLAPKPSDPH